MSCTWSRSRCDTNRSCTVYAILPPLVTLCLRGPCVADHMLTIDSVDVFSSPYGCRATNLTRWFVLVYMFLAISETSTYCGFLSPFYLWRCWLKLKLTWGNSHYSPDDDESPRTSYVLQFQRSFYCYEIDCYSQSGIRVRCG